MRNFFNSFRLKFSGADVSWHVKFRIFCTMFGFRISVKRGKHSVNEGKDFYRKGNSEEVRAIQ